MTHSEILDTYKVGTKVIIGPIIVSLDKTPRFQGYECTIKEVRGHLDFDIDLITIISDLRRKYDEGLITCKEDDFDYILDSFKT